MKAVVVPEVGATWEVRDVPIPRPGAGEVLIKVRASGICFNDVLATRGVIAFPSTSPVIPGHEFAGEIVELGPGVTTRRVGDRVGVSWVQGGCGRCSYCRLDLPVSGQTALNCAEPVSTGFTTQGGQAEYAVALAAGTILLPDDLPPELAAPVMCAGYTSWSALRQGEPKPHERVAVLGIGGLGHLALQFSRACGFETIAITSAADKHDLARQLGADVVVGNGAELHEAGGADVVLATGSSYRAASDAIRGLRVNGRLVLAGIDATDGFDLAPDPSKPFFAQRHRIIGATHGGAAELREALDVVATGRVRPVVETYEPEQIATAVARLAGGAVRFRAVVRY